MIDIPDFSSLTDDDLHAWEFRVYDLVPDDRELHEIIGVEKAREYYDLRGERLDLAELREIAAEIELLRDARAKVAERLSSKTSGGYHFHRCGVYPVPPV